MMLVEELARLGHQVTVLVPADACPSELRGATAQPYTVSAIKLPRKGRRYVLGALALGWHLLRTRPQAVFVAELMAQYAAALIMAVFPARLRYAVIVHSDFVRRRLSEREATWRARIYQRLLRRLYLRASAVICVSAHTRQGVLDVLPLLGSRAVVVRNGVDPNGVPSSPGEDAHEVERVLAGSDPVLLTVARLVPEKGIDTVLTALPQLVTEFPKLMYVIVGDGEDRATLGTLAQELSVAEHVHFAGLITGGRLHAWYRACDVFVMLSRREEFALVYLEAGTHGKPVVGARSGGVPELVQDGHNGFLVEPGDPYAAGTAIRRLLKDPHLRAKMGAAGRARVEQCFTAQRMAQETVNTVLKPQEGQANIAKLA